MMLEASWSSLLKRMAEKALGENTGVAERQAADLARQAIP
jgi:hypothetical protein